MNLQSQDHTPQGGAPGLRMNPGPDPPYQVAGDTQTPGTACEKPDIDSQNDPEEITPILRQGTTPEPAGP